MTTKSARGARPQPLPDEGGEEVLGGELAPRINQEAWCLRVEVEGAGAGQLPVAGRAAPALLAHGLGIFHLDGDEGRAAVRGEAAHEEVEYQRPLSLTDMCPISPSD